MSTRTPTTLCTLEMPTARRIDTNAHPSLLERFTALQSQCIDPDTFDGSDFELWHTLDGHAHQGGSVLDLRRHGEALARVPAELMEAFFDVCRCQTPALQALYLPSALNPMAGWLGACPDGVLIVQEADLAA
jgi:hypothetical protein